MNIQILSQSPSDAITEVWFYSNPLSLNSRDLPEGIVLRAQAENEEERPSDQECTLGRKRILLRSLTTKLGGNERMEFFRIRGGSLNQALESHREPEVFIQVLDDAEAICPVLEGFLMAAYKYTALFSKPEKKTHPTQTVLLPTEMDASRVEEIRKLVEAVNFTRDLVNEPNLTLSATAMAEKFRDKGKESGFSVEVLNKAKIESLKMGGLLAVNKGSLEPPTFTIMEYKPENPVNSKPFVLVGKGVVYDTGGLSLKPTPNSMDMMKCDMGGAGAVAGAITAIATNQLPVHIIGLVPATDNRPGGAAYAPGDVITMMDGTTVEVMNTDAEGRLILADALSYAKRYDPELVIDLATLTGAAARAIGKYAIVGMSIKSQSHMDKLVDCGFESGDRIWQFPMWEEYKDELKSTIADLKNIGSAEAGMITAGKFLEHFTDYPYIHLDIAGPSFLTSPYRYYPAGGTGAGVRVLYSFFKSLSNK